MKSRSVVLAATVAISLSALPVLAAIPVPGAANTNIILFNPSAEKATPSQYSGQALRLT